MIGIVGVGSGSGPGPGGVGKLEPPNTPPPYPDALKWT